MNFKKLSYLPIGFLAFFLNGCASVTIKNVEQPLVETIWKEVKKMTELNENQPLPKINYLKDCYEYSNPKCYSKELCDPEAEQKRIEALKKNNKKEWKQCRKKIKSDALGIYYYHCQIIGICLNNMNDYHWRWKLWPSSLSLNLKERKAASYNTLAHELLHHALFLKDIKRKNHQIMKEKGYMEKMIDLISAHFNLPLDGLQKEISMESLDKGIQLDEENNNEIMVKNPLIEKCGAGNDEVIYRENYDNFYIKCD